jgi:hypothetical protein
VDFAFESVQWKNAEGFPELVNGKQYGIAKEGNTAGRPL